MSDDAQISDEHDVTIIQFSRTRVYRELSLKASELSDRIAACAAAARRVLGTGWPKNIYEEALGINLARDGIKFERNKSIDVVFRGTRIGSHCFAFIVDEEIAVELATSGDDRDFHPADFRSYLRVCDVQSGLLIDLRAEEIRVRHIGAEAVARGPEFPEQGVSSAELRPSGKSLVELVQGEVGNDAQSFPAGGDVGHDEISGALANRQTSGFPKKAGRVLVTLLAIVGVAMTGQFSSKSAQEAQRSEVEGWFPETGYFDSETCRRLSGVLSPERET